MTESGSGSGSGSINDTEEDSLSNIGRLGEGWNRLLAAEGSGQLLQTKFLSYLQQYSDDPELVAYTNIEGLEKKMSAIMLERKEEFKKDRDDGKKSLIECIKEISDLSDEEWEVMEAIKVKAVELGIELSHLLITFVFIMLGQEEVAAKIGLFKSFLLKCISGDENDSSIIKIIINLLKMVDREMGKIQKPQELEEKDELNDSNQKDNQSQIDQILFEFLDQVMHLESILSHPGIPESLALKDKALGMVKDGLKQFEEKLKGLAKKINTLKVVFSFIVEEFDGKMNEIQRIVELKVNELWNKSNE